MNRVLAVILLGGLSIGCAGEPFLIDGDAGSAQVGYGRDPAAAAAVAKAHCARYERVPRFLEAQDNVAYFDCVQP